VLSASRRDLSFAEVSHSYSAGVLALNGIDLHLGPGITGLVGANGAGKTTLLRIAAGAMKPWRGRLEVGSNDLYGRERKLALRSLSWMPQAGAAPRSLTVMEFVTYVTWLRGYRWHDSRERAVSSVKAVELGDVADVQLRRLSGGMIRRVWLAQALAPDAQVLLLDEPSTGLDPRQRATMVRLLAEITDRTVVLSSHILEDVAELATRVVVLDKGCVRFDGPTPRRLDADWFLQQTMPGQ